VANVHLHGTTQHIVAEHFAQERPSLQALLADLFNGVIGLERRISSDRIASVGEATTTACRLAPAGACWGSIA
jgi:hypothetical protein